MVHSSRLLSPSHHGRTRRGALYTALYASDILLYKKLDNLIVSKGFWILWWHNLLLPALFLRLIYALLRRRFLPYPSLKELQAHRAQLARATEFGKQLHNRLSATSTLGVKDAWRLFKLLNKDKKRKVKETAEYIGCDNPTASPADADTSTVVDDQTESKEERDLKRLLLTIMNEIADLHERFKKWVLFLVSRHSCSLTLNSSLFRWRHPVSSRIYGCVRSSKACSDLVC